MNPPTVNATFDGLPTNAAQRHQAFVDLFGQHLFSLRNQRLAAIRQLIKSPETLKRLATIRRQPYLSVANLDTEAQDAAIDLAQTAVDLYLQDLLRLLQNMGTDVRLGNDHAIRYRLSLEIMDAQGAESPIVDEALVNRGGERALESNFGRWLNAFGEHR